MMMSISELAMRRLFYELKHAWIILFTHSEARCQSHPLWAIGRSTQVTSARTFHMKDIIEFAQQNKSLIYACSRQPISSIPDSISGWGGHNMPSETDILP